LNLIAVQFKIFNNGTFIMVIVISQNKNLKLQHKKIG